MTNHAPYVRQVPGARSVVLCIHGIMGTPRHFDRFLSAVPDDWSVYNLLLDGHGGDVKQFSRSSMLKWKHQVEEETDRLTMHYDRVLILGHSMGTLFAIQAALRHPEKVRQLVLLAVPLALRVRFSAVINSWCVALDRVPSQNAATVAAKAACGVAPEWRPWRYIRCLPRYVELLGEIKKTRKKLGWLITPCRVFQSRKDELVSPRAAAYLADLPTVELSVLTGSSHYYYNEADAARVRQELANLCANMTE